MAIVHKLVKGVPMTEQFRQLEVGDMLLVPAALSANANTYASRLGFQWGRKFTTHTNRENGVFEITRTL